MHLNDSESTTLRGVRPDGTARPRRPLLVAGFWIAGMLLALAGALSLVAVWILGTPPPTCRLPRAPVPATPGLIVWSADSAHLMAACESGVYVVDLPGQGVRRLPMPKAHIWKIWFDFQGRPLALARSISGLYGSVAVGPNSTETAWNSSTFQFDEPYRLLRWEDAAQAWRPVGIQGHQASISRDGRFIAALHFQPAKHFPRAAGKRQPLKAPTGTVAVTDLRSGASVKSFRYPRPGVPFLDWQNARTLYLFQGVPVTKDMVWTVGDVAPKPGPPGGMKQPQHLTAWDSEFHSGETEVLARLRSWKVPGIPLEDPVDLTLGIGPFGKPAEREFELGRLRSILPYGTFRPEPLLSPDGRYVAAVGGDGTLRLLDLKPTGGGAQ